MRNALALLVPPGRVRWLVAAAIVSELALGAQPAENLYHQGGWLIVFTVAFVVWFWLSVGWLVAGLVAGAGWLEPRVGRGLARVATGGLLAVAGLVLFGYLLSWGLYLQAGQFLNVESIRFTLTRWNLLYFFHTEDWLGLKLGLFATVAVVGLPLGWGWVRRARVSAAARGRGRRELLVWLVVTVVWLGIWNRISDDPSQARAQLRTNWLENRVHPSLTLVVSLAEFWRAEPIAAALDTRGLVDLKETGQWPGGWPADRPRPSIIFVAMESLRSDVVHLQHQGQPVLPNMDALARDGVWFTRAYAQSTHSDYSDVTVMSSRYPLRTRWHHYYSAADPWPRVMLYDLLRPLGYATAVISSQNEAWGGMDQFLQTRGLEYFFDSSRSGRATHVSPLDTGFAYEIRIGALHAGSLEDSVTTDEALRWMGEQVQAGRPFLLSLDFQESHFPYEMPPQLPRPFQPCTIDFPASFFQYPIAKTEVVRNAYFNAAHESDKQLGRIVAQLRAWNRLDDTILVVYGENGEMFHEHHRVTHAREPFEPAVHVACVLHAPRYAKARVEDYPLELIDLAPTVLGLLGWPRSPGFQGCDVLAAQRPALARRALYLHTETPFTHTDAVIGAGRWKYWIDRATGGERLYDLATDPQETNDCQAANVAVTTRLRAAYQQWRREQLAFYHYPFYYSRYHPPRPPLLLETP